MTEQQKEGTRIIAEFMGGIAKNNNYGIPGYMFDDLDKPCFSNWVLIEHMRYHTSFDWLMPVYVKFRKLIILNNWRDREVENMVSSLWYVVVDKLCNGEPAPLFIAMVDLLKYYNEEKK